MMNWNTLISAKRFGLEEFHQERHENRSEFQRDYDRLIFSAPFRRLQNKTQVFPLPGSVFVHNRLTHSLEVSCVGRSLGNDVSKVLIARHPELQGSYLTEIGSIVSAACLAHDLGNPPFGHSGERAISTFFSEGKGMSLKGQLTPSQWEDLTHFEGNANAFRLLTHQFEGRRQGGFVLTYSTLASIVKYPFSSSLAGKKSKFGFFITEEESFHRIAEELGMGDKMAGPKTVVVDTWVEADGQRLKVDQLEAYPTHTEIHLQEDPENTCWLAGAEFAFVDGNGKEYDTGDGYITATGGEDSRSMLHYYRQSLYFLEGQEMTLSIRRLKWLDKEQEWADIDLAAGTACGLPEGTELLQVCREGDRTILLFRQAEGGPDAPFTFLFRDPEGTERTFDGVTTSGTAEEVDGRKHVEYLYHIQNCAWDRIQIQLAHTETADHEDLNIPFVLP